MMRGAFWALSLIAATVDGLILFACMSALLDGSAATDTGCAHVDGVAVMFGVFIYAALHFAVAARVIYREYE